MDRYILKLLLWVLRVQGLSLKSITQQLNVGKQDDFYGFSENSKDIEWSVIQYETSSIPTFFCGKIPRRISQANFATLLFSAVEE